MVKVSGVPYDVDIPQSCKTCAELREMVESLKQENKTLRATVKTLTEECNWLESKTREFKQSTQGEH